MSRLIPPRKIIWIPSPPASGSQSMDRYWRELEQLAAGKPASGLSFRALLPGPPVRSRRAGRMARAWQRYLEFPLRVRATGACALFHLLDHSHAHVLPLLRGKGKTIVTVHDLIPLRDASGLTPAQGKRFRRVVQNMRHADLILADSDFTAEDVRALLGADCPPLRTLPLGVDAARFREPRREPKIDALDFPSGVPVLLCVGSGLARKNMEILPAICAAVLREIPALGVLKIGSRFPETTQMELRKLEPALVIREIPAASEEELVAAYQRADVLLFPSLLEGFGLPVLEAMAAGTPVVASNATSIPEVGGDVARYFAPLDAGAAAREIVAIVTDESLRKSLAERGLARAAQFDWSVHFEKLSDIYREFSVAPVPTIARVPGRLRRWANLMVVTLARALGSPIHDVVTGRFLGRALLLSWRGTVHVIGLEEPVKPVFLHQERVTYWQQQIGFTTLPKPDFPHEPGA